MLNTKMVFHQYSNGFAVFAMHRFLLEFLTIEGKNGEHSMEKYKQGEEKVIYFGALNK